MLVAGETVIGKSSGPADEPDSVVEPDGMLVQVEVMVRLCPATAPGIVSWPVALLYETSTAPVSLTEPAGQPRIPNTQLIAVSRPLVTFATVTPVMPMFDLPSHVTLNPAPPMVPPVHLMRTLPCVLSTGDAGATTGEMNCGTVGVGDTAVALLDHVPLSENLQESLVLTPLVAVIVMKMLLPVAVYAPPGVTTTIALACATEISETAPTRPTRINRRNCNCPSMRHTPSDRACSAPCGQLLSNLTSPKMTD
jgi:hypothetical protein